MYKKRILENELLIDDIDQGLWISNIGFQIPKKDPNRLEIIINGEKNKVKDSWKVTEFLKLADLIREESNVYKLKLNKEWFYYPYNEIGRRDIIKLGNFDINSSVFLINPNNGEEIYLANQDQVTLSKTVSNEFLVEE